MSSDRADGPPDQTLPGLEQARSTVRSAKAPAAKPDPVPAETDPIASVLLTVPLAHLDRPFDYLVTQDQAEAAVPGARVKVRFAGQETDGFIVARGSQTQHTGKLTPLRRVVSAEPVLTTEIAELTGEIARRWAGTRADVLRLAIPPRHASTEKQPSAAPLPIPSPDRSGGTWIDYDPGLPGELAAGGSPRVVWSCLPGDDWAPRLATAAAATAASGRGALVCVPDHRDVARLDQALTDLLGPDRHVVLRADVGPARRYDAFLRVRRGAVRIVIGTRAAAFAPLPDLGLAAIWDDGDDLFAEPRAPYPHTRDVLLLRARQTGCAAVVGGYARSVEAEYLLRSGWAREAAAPREAVRERVRVSVPGATDAARERDPFAAVSRIPAEVHRVIMRGLTSGPVLVQTPRAGYATRLACEHCRAPAACGLCHGPLRIEGPAAPPTCTWCATPAPDWSCPVCGGRGLRAPVLGDVRTAEELGRSFSNVVIRSSSGDRVLAGVPAKPSIVVATTGAEPVAEDGYAAVVLLDSWLLLARADLRAEEEALRRWANAAALVRPGGDVVIVGDPGHPAVQALVRWDPGGYARRLIEERQSAHLPPASRVATLTGSPAVLEQALGTVLLPEGSEVLGPVSLDSVDGETERYVVRVPRASGPELSQALGDLQRSRSAKKQPHVRIVMDPMELG